MTKRKHEENRWPYPGVMRRGSVWWIQMNVRGRVYREPTGIPAWDERRKQPINAKKAKAYRDERLGELRRDVAVPTAKKRAYQVRLRDLVTLLLDDVRFQAKVKGLSAGETDQRVRRAESRVSHLVKFFTDKCLVLSITPARQKEYWRWRLNGGHGTRRVPPRAPAIGTLNHELVILGRMYNLGASEGWLVKRGFELAKQPAHNERDKAFTRAQFDKLIAAMYEDHYHHAVVLQFCYYSGMRIGSVMALTWDDVDFEKEFITFTQHLKHRTKELIVPFSEDPEFKELIQKHLLWVQRAQKRRGVIVDGPAYWINDDRAVFVNPRTGRKLRGFNYEIMKRHCAELHIPYGNTKDALTPHSLRTTFKTEHRKAGTDRVVLAEAGGWEKGSVIMDRSYDDVQLEDLQEAQRRRVERRNKFG